MKDAQQDQIYATPQERISRFSFDERVAHCFPDMINRSVPGYAQITAMCALFAERHLRPGAHIYDLGCSHGAASLAICERLAERPFTLTAVDLSPAMVARARANLAAHCPAARLDDVELIEGDILALEYRSAGMIVLNFTLQFLPPERRAELLERLFDALEPGGVLVLSEKVRFEPEEIEHEIFDLHHDFKRANGYSQLEISQKRSALEEVMLTDTLELHHQRLEAAGFARHFTWFQYLNFASILALKAS
ncbi:carboxy-S-adenosyl-L-methionine synthase CmoA [Halotalea alkalilenta]|uniref:carboxy-S-adenosyl-L-methionine synthase CmoA n=1 Tax=Halotalea alkalilenta TaxID=376489 RepID=UPI000486EB47|nr:carboxy-S-adenosyl-L-methionine synthase CmoA [Halotalea alkalilenta]